MFRMILAAAAAFALASSTPAVACPDCNECPHHKDHATTAEKADKKDAAKTNCACAEGKGCKCSPHCQCPECAAKKPEKKEGGKKS